MAVDNDLYTYQPLKHNQLRLVKFANNGDLAKLEIFSVDGPLPPFHALSYTWAPEQSRPSQTILAHSKTWSLNINDCRLPVLDTLRPFVMALRHRAAQFLASWWWIDSICIDQSNMAERAQQVQLMSHMYLQAVDVIVWLGPAAAETNSAIDFILYLESTMNQQPPPTLEQIRTTLQTDAHQPSWDALAQFFARPWWSRVWTIQEFVIPSTLSFWSGARAVSRVAVLRALKAADRCPDVGIKQSKSFWHAYNRKRAYSLFTQHSKRMATAAAGQCCGGKTAKAARLVLPLLPLAAYFSNMDATDDRDRLYGLRALATDGHLLPVDYNLSVPELYTRFAREFIEHHKSLDIICFASVYNNGGSDDGEEPLSLPSWVPDWHHRDAVLSMPTMVSQSAAMHVGNLRPVWALDVDPSVRFKAAGDKAADCEFRGSRTLVARGVVVDEVDWMAAGMDDDYDNTSMDQSSCTTSGHGDLSVLDILQSVCRCLVLDRGDRFLRHRMSAEKFLLDFMTLLKPIITSGVSQSSESLEQLRRWYDATKNLTLQGRSFEHIFREGLAEFLQSNPSQHVPNQDEWISDSFFGRFIDTVVRMGRRLMVSRDGRIGMAGGKAKKGDLICVLYGCSVPVLLRRRPSQSDVFSFVDECFLDGCMDGSAVVKAGMLDTFEID